MAVQECDRHQEEEHASGDVPVCRMVPEQESRRNHPEDKQGKSGDERILCNALQAGHEIAHFMPPHKDRPPDTGVGRAVERARLILHWKCAYHAIGRGAGPDRDEVVLSLQARNPDRHPRFQLTDLPDRIGADEAGVQVWVAKALDRHFAPPKCITI
jgi:hypothetical protein